MARSGLLSLILLVLAVPAAVGATGLGSGRGRHWCVRVDPCGPEPGEEGLDFKVLVWYRRNDPLGTFKYEVYDLRRPQNLREIDTWLTAMRMKHPDYAVIVHDVDLDPTKSSDRVAQGRIGHSPRVDGRRRPGRGIWRGWSESASGSRIWIECDDVCPGTFGLASHDACPGTFDFASHSPTGK